MLITPIHFYNNIYITIFIHLFIHLFIYYIYIFIYTKHTINTCVFGVTFFQPLEIPDTMQKANRPGHLRKSEARFIVSTGGPIFEQEWPQENNGKMMENDGKLMKMWYSFAW